MKREATSLIPIRSNACLDFFVNGALVAQNVPFEDRHCSNLRNCFICNASEEACVLWSSFLVSSVLRGSIGSVANSSDNCGFIDEFASAQSSHSHAGHNQRDWDITLNGSCDSVLLQVVLRGPTGTGCDITEALGFGFSSVFSLEPFNSVAIESCNRAVHGRDIARSLRVGDAFADVVFIAEGVRFPAHKVDNVRTAFSAVFFMQVTCLSFFCRSLLLHVASISVPCSIVECAKLNRFGCFLAKKSILDALVNIIYSLKSPSRMLEPSLSAECSSFCTGFPKLLVPMPDF